MSLRDFVFSIRIEGAAPVDDLVADVAGAIARDAGCSSDSAGELVAAIRRAVGDQCATGATCDVQFRAHGGEMEVSVVAGGREWRARRSIA